MKYMHTSKSIFFTVCFTVLLSSCSVPRKQASSNAASPTNGFSGLANIDSKSYLAVHDARSFEKGNRMSVIHTSQEENIKVYPVKVTDWKHSDGRSSDLEAVCKLPDRNNEFLLVEAGHWEGKYGRMFHIKLNESNKSYSGEVLGVFELPEFDAKGPGDFEGDDIEGVVCAAMTENTALVILGERGGSSVYPSGLLRWVVADLASHTLSWSASGRKGKTVDAPGLWQDASKNRDIASLYLDSNQVLWATAAEDQGDSGPFNSIIFKVGVVNANNVDPIQLLSTYSVARSINGFKTEGLAGPTSEVPGSVFSIGTEDEVYGGVWRLIK